MEGGSVARGRRSRVTKLPALAGWERSERGANDLRHPMCLGQPSHCKRASHDPSLRDRLAAVLGSGEQPRRLSRRGCAAARIIPLGRCGDARYTTSADVTGRRANRPNRPMCGVARGRDDWRVLRRCELRGAPHGSVDPPRTAREGNGRGSSSRRRRVHAARTGVDAAARHGARGNDDGLESRPGVADRPLSLG